MRLRPSYLALALLSPVTPSIVSWYRKIASALASAASETRRMKAPDYEARLVRLTTGEEKSLSPERMLSRQIRRPDR